MSRRRLVLAGGTVAFTAIGVVKRARRPPRMGCSRSPLAAVVAAPLAAGLLSPQLFGFDVGGFVGSIWDFGWNVAQEIKDWVLEVVRKAIEGLLEVIRTVKEVLDAGINALVGSVDYMASKVSNVVSALGGVLVDTYQMLDMAFTNFREQAKALLEGAWDGLKDWVTTEIPGWIRGVLGDVWDVLQALVGIGLDGIGFLINLIDDPINFIWDLISGLVDQAIEAAMTAAGFTWDVFWGLFWPLLARQLGLPENPDDMIAAAKFLFDIALLFVTGNVTDAAKKSVEGLEAYLAQRIPQEIHKNADLLVDLIYRAMGIQEPPGVVEQLKTV